MDILKFFIDGIVIEFEAITQEEFLTMDAKSTENVENTNSEDDCENKKTYGYDYDDREFYTDSLY